MSTLNYIHGGQTIQKISYKKPIEYDVSQKLIAKKGTIENLTLTIFEREFQGQDKNKIVRLWIDGQFYVRDLRINSEFIKYKQTLTDEEKFQNQFDLEEALINAYEDAVNNLIKETLLYGVDPNIKLVDYLKMISNHMDNREYWHLFDRKNNELKSNDEFFDWIEANPEPYSMD